MDPPRRRSSCDCSTPAAVLLYDVWLLVDLLVQASLDVEHRHKPHDRQTVLESGPEEPRNRLGFVGAGLPSVSGYIA